jgi:hypothetical protein
VIVPLTIQIQQKVGVPQSQMALEQVVVISGERNPMVILVIAFLQKPG